MVGMARGVVVAFGLVGVAALLTAVGCTSTSAMPTCTLGAPCSNASLCMGGIPGCTSNCQCLDGKWQVPCPTDLPQTGSACTLEGEECGYVTSTNACEADNCYCQSGAWDCEPSCAIGPEYDSGATDARTDANEDAASGDAGTISIPTCADASAAIFASSYDQSCKVDSDCVSVGEGNLCNECSLVCRTATINASAGDEYLSAFTNTPAGAGPHILAAHARKSRPDLAASGACANREANVSSRMPERIRVPTPGRAALPTPAGSKTWHIASQSPLLSSA
jgi:hypothetical protein